MNSARRPRHPAGYSILWLSTAVVCLALAVLLFGPTEQAAPTGSQGHEPPATASPSADWPMWRYDAGRTAASPAALPAALHLQWVRELPQPAPAWPEEQYKLQFDRSYEPVVMGKQIFVPSMVSDKVVAYDTDTGRQNWQFFCDGPVRFAPIAWQGRVYCASDDGCLYCLDAQNGGLVWKSRLAPAPRKVLGNGRLISAWPARGGPVLQEGKIYCGASIWPFMGVFLYALDAVTGKVIWCNSGTGAMYLAQPHLSPAFAGVAPQGYMAAGADKLLVTSRTVPACFDPKTGAFLYYRLSENSYGKTVGGCGASLWNDWYFNGKVVYRLADGLPLGTLSGQVMTKNFVAGVDAKGHLLAYRLGETLTKDAKTKKNKTIAVAQALWKTRTEPTLDRLHLAAGNCLYGSNRQGEIAAVRIPESNEPAAVVWREKVPGQVWTMLAGDHKLFVVTEEGQLYCYGTATAEPKHYRNETQELPAASGEEREQAKQILEQMPDARGYCLWLGTGPRGLLTELLQQSPLRIVVIEPDTTKVASLRQELDRAGQYGTRAAVLPGDLGSVDVPPYLASLVVVADLAAAGLDETKGSLERLYELLRPYSGVAWIAAAAEAPALRGRLAQAGLAGLKVDARNDTLIVRRTGPVPGSADWTHQYGDVANTLCSKDQLQPPLGILWFGEESAFGDVLPRHGHGPPEQVRDGRLFIEGIDSLSARDVYTGRTLWRKPLKAPGSFGVYYNATYKHDFRDLGGNQKHIAGANARGTNFVVTPDRVYVLQENACHVLDPKTGQTQQVFHLPAPEGQAPKEWGYLGVCDDCLIGGTEFVPYPVGLGQDLKDPNLITGLGTIASKKLVVMNRHTG